MLFVRVSLALLATASTTLGIVKHWLPDLEWQTGSNWIDGRLPDADSIVIFPEQTWHTVGLPNSGSLEVAKIYLPLVGALALGTNAVMTFKEVKEEKFVKWAKKGLYLWIDPDNWDGYTEATPHADRIPCRDDAVVLPAENRVVSMVLPSVSVQVEEVRIAGPHGDRTLLWWEWKLLADGRREFTSNRFTVTYSYLFQMSKCTNCACHADDSIVTEVCSYMWHADRCGPPACEYPLKVEGHCCDFCGGRLRLSDKASRKEVESRVSEALENWRDVITWHVRNTWDGNAEVLIAEKGEYSGINSQEAVDVLSRALLAAGFEILANQATGANLVDSQLSNVLGPLLGIPVILILLLLVLFPYYGYSYSQVFTAFSSARVAVPSTRKKSSSAFGFARFKNVAEGDVDLDETVGTEAKEAPEEDSDTGGPSSSSKRFENPLYRSMRDEKKGDEAADEKMIDVNAPLSFSALESRVQERGIEEVKLE